MRRHPAVLSLLQNGGFAPHYYVGRIVSESFAVQSVVLALVSAGAAIIAGSLDGALFLPGADIGLFQHPVIWTFIALQVALPLCIRRSLEKLTRADQTALGPRAELLQEITQRLMAWVRLRAKPSRVIAGLIYTIGLAAFVWNTYQNQLPHILLPYDFWDSANYPCGYWVTRVYKLYLFVWVLPYIALIHVGVLSATLLVLREWRKAGTLQLQPFHPDGAGGLGFVPALITAPIIVTALTASIAVAAAFEVHRSFDVTPVMGATLVIGGALAAYAVPICFLRTDIQELKRASIKKVCLLQEQYYEQFISGENLTAEKLREAADALTYFEKILDRLNGISNYPHLVRLLKFLGLALTPSLVSLILKMYQVLGPTLIPLLKRP